MNSAIAAIIGLALAIALIIRKQSPAYSLILGALLGGILAGWGLEDTVLKMISGVKDISPAILRILAAGVLTGALIRTRSAESIAGGIIRVFGEKQAYLAIALSAMVLTGVGVFVDVSVITVAPIILIMAKKAGLPLTKLLFAAIAGGKCGNIMSPNPNTIISAENYGASLPDVMAAGVVPALVGLFVSVYLIVPLVPGKKTEAEGGTLLQTDGQPAFPAAIAGPLFAILLLALRPLFGIKIDPMVALPAGGLVCLLTTRQWRITTDALRYGLEKMSGVAVLLAATGTIAGIIKSSSLSEWLIAVMQGWQGGQLLMAPLTGALMSGATASTTAGATIASSSFASAVLATGVSAVWAAAMTNAGATMIDHLPHGSFFHTTGGSVEMSMGDRLRLIPFESLTGFCLTLMSVLLSLFFA